MSTGVRRALDGVFFLLSFFENDPFYSPRRHFHHHCPRPIPIFSVVLFKSLSVSSRAYRLVENRLSSQTFAYVNLLIFHSIVMTNIKSTAEATNAHAVSV
jgi:hypothetical protein